MKKMILLLLTLVWLSGCTSLKTPEINGVVVDAETGKPIEGAYVVASWGRTYGSVGGRLGGKDVKEIKIQTDANGYFGIPKYTTINWAPSPFGQGGSFFMAIYQHQYKCKKYVFYKEDEFTLSKYQDFRGKRSDGKLLFKMKLIKDPTTFAKNISETYGLIENDLSFQLKEYQLFISKFPAEDNVPGYMLSIGTIYEKMMQRDNAINEYKKIIQFYPDSDDATTASQRILRLSR